MTTPEGAGLARDRAHRSAELGGADAPDAPGGDGSLAVGSSPSTGHRFWHRAHPTFTPLAGFFTGTLLVVLVLGILGVVLSALFDVEISEHPGPFLVAILGLFVLNVLLLVAPGTRRFARYMLFGLVVTPVVVGGVAALTVLVLINNDA